MWRCLRPPAESAMLIALRFGRAGQVDFKKRISDEAFEMYVRVLRWVGDRESSDHSGKRGGL
jgi:hypothetical protein